MQVPAPTIATVSLMDNFDLIIRNGLIYTGEGGANPQTADIGIQGNKIRYIGINNQARSIDRIDATGHVVMPGFVDVHSHTDESALRPEVDSKLLQGVTTEICGQCGGSPAPFSSSESIQKRKRIKMDEDGWFPRDMWTSFADYFSLLGSRGCAVNQAIFAGWWTLCDSHSDEWTKHTFHRVLSALERGLADGAGGLSIHQESQTWTQLSPAQITQTSEILSRAGKPVAIHLSDYSDKSINLIKEIVAIFGNQNTKIQISHMKILGQERNITLKRFEELIASDNISRLIRFDVVPFPSICTRLHFLLERSTRTAACAVESTGEDQSYFNYLDNFTAIRGLRRGWAMERSNSRVWSTKERSTLRDLSCGTGGNELVEAEGLEIAHISRLLGISNAFVGSDSSSFPVNSADRSGHHPRVFQTFPAAIKHLLGLGSDLSQVASKISSEPCQWFQIDRRGKLIPGWWADIVIARFGDQSKGPLDITVRDIIVNGKIAVRDGLTVDTTQGVPIPI